MNHDEKAQVEVAANHVIEKGGLAQANFSDH
jgi:hypothetical protein